MKNLSLDRITQVTGGVFYGQMEELEKEISSITTDSRKAEPGCLFAAISGNRVDGHDFIGQVAEQGALAVLSEKVLEAPPCAYILVESTLDALKSIAEDYLAGLNIPVVGISGSVGKTSTKEAIASVLSRKMNTLKTEGNFNNELGLPLTIFRLRPEHEAAVLEMGISGFGEMSRLAKIAKPSVGVITNIGTCHLENLGDRDGVFRAKTEMLDHVRIGGHLVLNGDDDKLAELGGTASGACFEERRKTLSQRGLKPVFFGLGSGNDVYADEIVSRGIKGTDCRIHMGDESFTVRIPIPGKHMVYNALCAAATGRIFGITPDEIKKGIEAIQAIGGRLHMVETGKLLIIDDCYNANPMSMKASLDVLKDMEGRKVAVLGDMAELGEDELELHRSVGQYAAGCGIDLLVCAGERSRVMAEAAEAAGASFQVIYEADRESLLAHLADYIREKDTVLVKASHSMKFEEVVEKLSSL